LSDRGGDWLEFSPWLAMIWITAFQLIIDSNYQNQSQIAADSFSVDYR